MADKIGINDEEYNKLIIQLKNNQKDFIDGMDEIINQINNLNSAKGGIQSQDISTNLKNLVKTVETVKKSVNTMFEGEKTTINSFRKAIVNYDK